MPEPRHVAVLAGGPDAEREISIISGSEIARALREHGAFEVSYHEIGRITLDELGAIPGDVVFPALHGPWGEGGPLQSLLEAAGRTFVGSGSVAAARAMNKLETKEIARGLGIPTPDARLVTRREDAHALSGPVVLKPIDDGSSVGVFICHDADAIDRAWQELSQRGGQVMVEQFIAGRELTVGVVGSDISSVIEIIPAVEFYDYEAKYERDDTRYTLDPDLPAALTRAMRDASQRLFEALGCRDLARIDYRLDDRGPTLQWGLLEVNTMPGFTSHSLVPMGELAGGVSLSELCARLVRLAWERA